MYYKIGEFKLTRLKYEDIDRWKHLIEILPIWYKNADGYHLLQSINGERIYASDNSLDIPKADSNMSLSYSATLVDNAESAEFFTFFDITCDYHFISVPKEFLNNPERLTPNKDDEYLLNVSFVNNIDRNITIDANNILGRWFYVRATFRSSWFAIKALNYKFGDNNTLYVSKYNKYEVVGVEESLIESDVNGSFNARYLIPLKALDVAVSTKGNVDADGYNVLPPISINEGNSVEVYGNSRITSSDVPITVMNTEVLTIRGKGTLLLEAGAQQPCIGSPTHTGMSYGRWSPGCKCSLKKIIIDGVKVIFKSKVDNFSIGSYNYKEYPEIECINGSSIEGCPEVTGKRILLYQPPRPNGSTKYSECPVYGIQKDGEDLPLTIEQQEIVDMLPDNLKSKVTAFTSVKFAKKALKLLKLNSELNVSPLLDDTSGRDCTLLINCVVLGMPAVLSEMEEWLFEKAKLDFLADKYKEFDPGESVQADSRVSTIANKIYGYKDFDELFAFDKRYIYEMIPSYFFNFEGDVENNAKRFYEIAHTMKGENKMNDSIISKVLREVYSITDEAVVAQVENSAPEVFNRDEQFCRENLKDVLKVLGLLEDSGDTSCEDCAKGTTNEYSVSGTNYTLETKFKPGESIEAILRHHDAQLNSITISLGSDDMGCSEMLMVNNYGKCESLIHADAYNKYASCCDVWFDVADTQDHAELGLESHDADYSIDHYCIYCTVMGDAVYLSYDSFTSRECETGNTAREYSDGVIIDI